MDTSSTTFGVVDSVGELEGWTGIGGSICTGTSGFLDFRPDMS